MIFWLLSIIITTYSSYSLERLPENINQHQPAIFPIISPNGNELFFSRKWHPENTGGLYDDDDIWVSPKLGYVWGQPKRLDENINTKESNSLLYIFPDGNKALLFGPYLASKEEILAFAKRNHNCFAITKRINGKWQKPEPLKIEDFYTKSNNYSATMSTDGRVLIMSLERNDTRGNLDIYISFYNPERQTYTKPQNLGDIINTKGIELVSFLAYDNKTLYFASNGRGGKGKLDLFLTRRLDETWLNWSEPIPLDFINSEWDENSISLNLTGDTAYFTSGDTIFKREGIYTCEIPEKFRPLPYLVIEGTIFSMDRITSDTIKTPVYFKVDNFDTDYIFLDTVYDSFFRYVVPNKTQYNFFISASGHDELSFSSSSSRFLEPTIQKYDIVLKKIRTEKRHIGTVYFETDQDTLNKIEKERLNRICNQLKEEKYSKLLLIGHTDEKGTEEYNFQLSFKRAKNIANTMKSILNIDDEQMQIEGKGKTEPISKKLSKNRRVEIFILE